MATEPLTEPRPTNRAEAVAKSYAMELAAWVLEQGWDFRFFIGAMLWTCECVERGAMREEISA